MPRSNYNLQTLFPRANSGMAENARGYVQAAGGAYGSMDKERKGPGKNMLGVVNNAFGGAMVGSAMQEAGVFGSVAEATVPEAGLAATEALIPEAVAGAVPEAGLAAAETAAAATAPATGAGSIMAGPWGIGLFALGTTFAYLMS